MSVIKSNAVQIGQSVTATNNFTWYQPATPDGTVRLGNGNSGSVTDLVTLTSAGNLGIGTSSPSTKLTVYDASTPQVTFNNGTSSFIVGNNNGGNNHILYGTGAYPIIFYTNSAEAMRIDSSGNLGLGVTPSGWGSAFKALQIGNNTTLFNDNGGGSYFTSNAYYDGGGYKYLISAYATNYAQYNGQHQWRTAASGTAGNAISFTQAMTLDASGNLLVGTTSSGFGNNGFAFKEGGVGTSWQLINHSTGGAAYAYMSFAFSGSQIGYISQNSAGTAVSYNTTSDQRLKTNITPAGSAIQSILDFPVDQFDWIASGEHQDFGAVAQKAIRFIPEMVSVPADPNEMWGIDWSKAVPRLIKTIQELHEEIQTLKAKVNA